MSVDTAMIEPAQKELAALCGQTATLAGDAARWIADEANADAVGREKDAIVREMKLAALRARRIEKAAVRPMCVGVFGPSQAGKSYLVEVLARPETGPLRAAFDGSEPLDFISQINPIGDKESTGLVTRFSALPVGPSPAGFPVRLRWLTELDVIKVLGNTFFLDGDQSKETVPSPEFIAQTIANLSTRAGQAGGGLTDEDVLDLQDYFQRQFGSSRYVDALGRYWEQARALAPNLDLQGKSELFALLWGGHAQFTRLYLDLATAIDQLERPDEVFCPLGALVPREGSILDVATLAGLGGQGKDDLEVRSPSGSRVLPRALVAALTAELRISLADEPRSFFATTDLLDFPGARSRQKVHLAHFLSERPDALKETFLRGKVAYLFDRYVAEQELTSMLLCVRPSIQEVATLPDMIDAWISSTHGATPEARAAQANLLFLVLTWFDSHFIDKAGDIGQEGGLRFRNRLEASLLGYFGKAHTWPRQWTPGKAFQNCYWFRNPNFPAETIIRYDGRVEIETIAEKRGRIAELRSGFMELPEAATHFRDPGRAFDEALKLNDGGISYIIENLAKVCRLDMKLDQLRLRLGDLRREIAAKLDRYYVSLDVEQRLVERRAAAGKAFDDLEPVIQAGGFGALLRALAIDPGQLNDIIYGVLRGVGGDKPRAAASMSFRISRPDQVGAGARTGPASGADREQLYARAAVEAWIGHLRDLASNDTAPRRLGITREALKTLSDEILTLLRRSDLEAALAEDLKALTTVELAEQSSAKIALVAALRLNRLIGDLGFGQLPPPKRPKAPAEGGEHPIFDERPITYDASAIGTPPKPFAQMYISDWFHGFYQVVEDNAVSTSGLRVDLKQNERLGAILNTLRAA